MKLHFPLWWGQRETPNIKKMHVQGDSKNSKIRTGCPVGPTIHHQFSFTHNLAQETLQLAATVALHPGMTVELQKVPHHVARSATTSIHIQSGPIITIDNWIFRTETQKHVDMFNVYIFNYIYIYFTVKIIDNRCVVDLWTNRTRDTAAAATSKLPTIAAPEWKIWVLKNHRLTVPFLCVTQIHICRRIP